jgi:hypothetical protein
MPQSTKGVGMPQITKGFGMPQITTGEYGMSSRIGFFTKHQGFHQGYIYFHNTLFKLIRDS